MNLSTPLDVLVGIYIGLPKYENGILYNRNRQGISFAWRG